MSQPTPNPEAAGVRPKSESLRRLYRSLPMLFLALVLLIAALEIGMRLAHISFPDFGVPDRDLGWALRPGAEGLVRSENTAGVHVSINSDGMRDSEHTVAKPPRTLRIVV